MADLLRILASALEHPERAKDGIEALDKVATIYNSQGKTRL